MMSKVDFTQLVTAQSLVALLQSHRFDLSTEKHLQEGVEAVLKLSDIPYEREKRLTPQDIPDFLVGDIAIECKLRNKSSKMAVYKQLVRYAALPQVSAIVLASNQSMGLPPCIDAKPVYYASLSVGWL